VRVRARVRPSANGNVRARVSCVRPPASGMWDDRARACVSVSVSTSDKHPFVRVRALRAARCALHVRWWLAAGGWWHTHTWHVALVSHARTTTTTTTCLLPLLPPACHLTNTNHLGRAALALAASR
jgi:hypothetical protein